jgi:hypothetical protein
MMFVKLYIKAVHCEKPGVSGRSVPYNLTRLKNVIYDAIYHSCLGNLGE